MLFARRTAVHVFVVVLALHSTAMRAGAQQRRDTNLGVSATVIASAPRVEHASVSAVSSKATGPLEREVLVVVAGAASGATTFSLVNRIDGVTVEMIGADGRATRIGAIGVQVSRTAGGREVTAPVLLRVRSSSPELLEQAAHAPVSLLVETSER